ncbi:MAG: tyrosine-protein phosphatase [Clostridia bacterium]|nr:tyrosine-protein phosphatase [Clostridia bacterium]
MKSKENSGSVPEDKAGYGSGSVHSVHGHRHKGKPFRKIRHFYKRNRKILRVLWILLLVVGLAVAAVVVHKGITNKGSSEGNDKQEGSAQVVTSTGIEVEPLEGEQCLIGPGAIRLLKEENYSARARAMMAFWSSGERLDGCVPVELPFRVTMPNGVTVKSIKAYLSEDPELRESRIFEISPRKRSFSFENLKVNSEYFYRVEVVFSNEECKESIGSFRTADTRRLLSVDGILNVRDVGNTATASGKRIKQGMLIRGMELDGAVQEQYKITDVGVLEMLTVLGIRTDMDMRSPEVDPGFDALGANVEHRYYDAVQYAEIFTPYGKENIKKIFTDLADPSLYPIFIHCTAGMDRSATVCALVEALLGVEVDEIYAGYDLSLLSNRRLQSEAFIDMIDRLQDYKGETLQKKAENYLLDCGITLEQIESIREILLG